MKGLFVVKENRPHNGVMPVARYKVVAIPCFDDTCLDIYKEKAHADGCQWDEFETDKDFDNWHELTNCLVYSQSHFEDAFSKKGISINWIF